MKNKETLDRSVVDYKEMYKAVDDAFLQLRLGGGEEASNAIRGSLRAVAERASVSKAMTREEFLNECRWAWRDAQKRFP